LSFLQVHKVVDAASEVLIEQLGERGRQSRTSLMLHITERQRGHARSRGTH